MKHHIIFHYKHFQICTRSPQFRGFQQQDAHELLRHLIEGIRVEEVKRQRRAILKFFGTYKEEYLHFEVG